MKNEKCFKNLGNIREKNEEKYLYSHKFEISVPINPTDTSFGNQRPPLYDVLGEDIRGIKYGIDTMLLMCAFTQYHKMLFADEDTHET